MTRSRVTCIYIMSRVNWPFETRAQVARHLANIDIPSNCLHDRACPHLLTLENPCPVFPLSFPCLSVPTLENILMPGRVNPLSVYVHMVILGGSNLVVCTKVVRATTLTPSHFLEICAFPRNWDCGFH